MRLEVREMVVGADLCHQSIPVLDVPYRCGGAIVKGGDFQTVEEISGPPPSVFCEVRAPDGVVIGAASVVAQMEPTEDTLSSVILQFVPRIRSGSFADIGHRRTMEDEHIRIDDLAAHLGSSCLFPTPSAFFGVFDGHGGPDAASYLRKNAVKLFFKEAGLPQTFQLEEELEDSVRRAFLLADLALADECNASSSSGTTALTALILGRLLLVANAGDCRAVLCRNGKAVEMSQDHRPIHAGERRRVEEAGGFVEADYLNGVLSVTRALGDWYMKLPPSGSPLPSSSLSVSSCPLIAEPEFRHAVLSEADEFLVMGCDGIWDVMSSQNAVNAVRWGLRRHNDPERCARELVMEALSLGAFDNLTVIVVCLSNGSNKRWSESGEGPRLKPCKLSREAVCRLKKLLEDGGR